MKDIFKPENRPTDTTLGWRVLVQCSGEKARKHLSYELAKRLRVLPLGVLEVGGRELLTVATDRIDAPRLAQELKFATRCEAKVVSVESSVLERALFAAYHDDESSLQNSMYNLAAVQGKAKPVDVSAPKLDDNGSAAAKFVATVVKLALSKAASDLHLVPDESGVLLHLRVDGEILTHNSYISDLQGYGLIVNRIKILSSLDTTKRNIPQEGVFEIEVPGGKQQARVSILPNVYGEKIVLRFLGTKEEIKLERLSLPTRAFQFFERVLNLEEGICIFSGPTGGGKSTSMYALIQEFHRRGLSVVSVEDPVEVRLKGISQTELNLSTGLDYPTALRAVLRQDPDVILIGEIRDSESAKIAFQAAMTGHLVLTTVHGGSLLESFSRLGQLGIPSELLFQTLKAAFCQKLYPRLCQSCRVVDFSGSKQLATRAKGYKLYAEASCKQCSHTGFLGRIPVIEGVYLERGMKERLRKAKDLQVLFATLHGERDFISFRESASEAALRGDISLKQFDKIRRSE